MGFKSGEFGNQSIGHHCSAAKKAINTQESYGLL